MHEENGFTILRTDELQIALSEKVVREFMNIQESGHFYKERGGIIVGYFERSLDSLVISDITHPQSNDVGSRFRFFRKSSGHQEIMDELWEKSGHRKSYLGEWHTHNQKVPTPSFVDTENWLKISRRRNNFDDTYFVIIGTEAIGVWGVRKSDIIKLGYIM